MNEPDVQLAVKMRTMLQEEHAKRQEAIAAIEAITDLLKKMHTVLQEEHAKRQAAIAAIEVITAQIISSMSHEIVPPPKPTILSIRQRVDNVVSKIDNLIKDKY